MIEALEIQRRFRVRVAREAAKLAVPAFLGLSVVLGGASRGADLAHGTLQVLSVAILAWCVIASGPEALPRRARPALWFALGFVALSVLQLVPLPPEVWTALPGRSAALEGFQLLGVTPPWQPISLAPLQTVDALLHLLPPIAMFMLVVRLDWRTATTRLYWAAPFIAAVSVGLGVFQLSDGRDSPAYFYAFTNWGSPVGFFANVNHQASFLLMALPFVAALAGRKRTDWSAGDKDYGEAIAIATLGLVLITGVVIAGSLTGYALLAPVLAASLLIFWSSRQVRAPGWRAGLGALLVCALAAASVFAGPALEELGVAIVSGGRQGLFRDTLETARLYLLTGSGLGSFEQVFALYEDPEPLTSTFINHAHNDYLELLLELGLPGMALLAAFLVWWLRLVAEAWRARSGDGGRLRKAAAVSTGVAALHSLVDYPLRTEALAVFAALGLALMASDTRAVRRRSGGSEGEPQLRHVKI